jgi:ribonuclease HI
LRVIEVYTDGSCPRNSWVEVKGPQPTWIGFVVLCDGVIITEQASPGTPGTNNTAEYEAIIAALEWLQSIGVEKGVRVYTDSRLIVSQFYGNYTIGSSPELARLWYRLMQLAECFRDIQIIWIPREQNLAHNIIEQEQAVNAPA